MCAVSRYNKSLQVKACGLLLFYDGSNMLQRNLAMVAVIFSVASCGGGEGTPFVSSSPSSSSSSSFSSSASSSSIEPQEYLQTEYLSGGEASIKRVDIDAFGQSPNAITSDFSDDAIFKRGNLLFRNTHTNAGPLLNTETCQGCHIKDGRGNPPVSNERPFTSMLMKLSIGNTTTGAIIPDPIYGSQLQTFGVTPEGNLTESVHNASLDGVTVSGEAYVFIDYEILSGSFSDGIEYQLRKPTYKIKNAAYGDFSSTLKISPRIAPPMIGLGLLGAISDEDIEALADSEDADGNGISGRASRIVNNTTGLAAIGRFGWKASTGSVLQQSAGAYRGDIGLTNQFAVDESCTELQTACTAMADIESERGLDVDVNDLELAFVEFYSRLLAVPERRGYNTILNVWDESINTGREIFENIGCDDCHIRHFKTASAKASVLGKIESLVMLVDSEEPIAVLSGQDIWPHTDLLLHDMGGSCEAIVRENVAEEACESNAACYWVQRCEGLADNRPDGSASGTEWRTSPLWGLGLTQVVNPDAGFLHDGRARTISEAILWHGGEAQAAQTEYKNLNEDMRNQLLDFLNSL